MQGARAVQRSIIENSPGAEIRVGIVWINMLQGDIEEIAQESSRIVEDPRVRHFHDPEKRSGKVIAQSIGRKGKEAWDIYLFYAKGSESVEEPPMPADWMHQCSSNGWADPAHFHFGDDLVQELHKTMKRLTDIRS